MKPALLRLWAVIAATLSLGNPSGAQTAASARSDYVQPGDVVKLWVWREEELSGEFPVPESGIVVFPKIGPWKVTETPTAQLRDTLRAEFAKFLRNPSVEITFLRRVNVLGAVREPGVYPLDPTMTVAMALAMAGGTTPEGRSDEVQLLRDGARLVAKISQRTRIAELPIQSGDQLYVPERSWVASNVPALVSGVLSLLSIAIAVFGN